MYLRVPKSGSRPDESPVEQTSAAERQPELVALLGVIGVDAQLAEPADAIDHGVAVDSQPIRGLPDAPAVEQRLEGRDELEAPVRCSIGERA
jgi:hypothetical protein